MMLNIGQLIEDAENIRQYFVDKHEREYGKGWTEDEDPTSDVFVQRIDRILAYFKERYVPPSEPGSYRDARGILDSDEPAEASIRRSRDDVIESGVNIDTEFECGVSLD